MNSDEVIELPPIDVSHLLLSNRLFYTKYFYILIMTHITFLFTSILIGGVTIFLYIRFKVSRNLYSRAYLCLMISEMINSAIKLISVIKLSDEHYKHSDDLCMMQGYLLSSTETTSVFIYVSIIIALSKLMIKQNSETFLKITKISASSFIFSCLLNLPFIFFESYGTNDQSTSIYCEFNVTNSSGRAIQIINHSIFAISILVSIIISIRLRRFLKKQAIKINEPKMINKFQAVVKKVMYLNICYVVWFVCEILVKQLMFNLFKMTEYSKLYFVVMAIYLLVSNSRCTLLFLFCLDEEYKKGLSNMIVNPNKKKKSINKALQDPLNNTSIN